jgi:hypothetical protein
MTDQFEIGDKVVLTPEGIDRWCNKGSLDQMYHHVGTIIAERSAYSNMIRVSWHDDDGRECKNVYYEEDLMIAPPINIEDLL